MRSVGGYQRTIAGPTHDIATAQTKRELRIALFDDLIEGSARWVDAAGFSARRSPSHARMLRALSDLRRTDIARPHTGIIDWSTAKDCAADGIALFQVIALTLPDYGTQVVCCAPTDPALADALQSITFPPGESLQWVMGERSGGSVSSSRRQAGNKGGKAKATPQPSLHSSHGVVVLPSSGVFDPTCRAARGQAGAVCSALGVAAARIGIDGDVAERAMAVAREAIANLRHSRAKRASVVAIVDTHRRRIELALADDGVGIARTMREKVPSSCAPTMPDRYWLGEALAGLAPGAEQELALRHGQRGFTRTLRRLLEATDVRAVIRSGGASVAVDRRGVTHTVVGSTIRGFGTQILLRIAA